MLKNCFNFYTLLATLIMLISTIATADVVDDAYRLCGAMEATGLTTECEVRGFGSTVDVTVDTNGSEARQICAGVTDMMAKKTQTFAGKWKLRIFSPYSGKKPIAVCTLK